MKKLKIALLSTALLMSVNHASQAAYTQNDLDTLRELSESDDTKALLAFIRANPDLLAGNDPLAKALKEFIEARDGFMGGIFGPRAPKIQGIPNLQSNVTSSAQVDFGSLGDFGS